MFALSDPDDQIRPDPYSVTHCAALPTEIEIDETRMYGVRLYSSELSRMYYPLIGESPPWSTDRFIASIWRYELARKKGVLGVRRVDWSEHQLIFTLVVYYYV